MGLFDLIRKKKKISAADQAVIDNFRNSVNTLLNTPRKQISPEEYARIREAERVWLEKHYDTSTTKSITAIPERNDIPRAPGEGPTGEVYYFLHGKARQYADEMKYDLAIACQKKSNTLIKFKYGNRYGRRECYYLVKLYARAGLIDLANREKTVIDTFYGPPLPGSKDFDYAQKMISLSIKQGKDERDFAWIRENLPELCPKSKTGFCRMRSQNTKNYQTLKQLAAERGKSI